jgi:steroid 5-alpha reductase family enzyme
VMSLGIGIILMTALMALLWGIQRRTRNAGIVDFGWGLGLVLLANLYAWTGAAFLPRKILLCTMVTFWGLRLAGYILVDRLLGKPEDSRYQSLRQKWQKNLSFKFFVFFEFQGLLDVLLSLPFFWICRNQNPSLGAWEWTGFGLWLIAFIGELMSDHELKRFKSDAANKGKTCRKGLWNYSRHPNYFFEWLIWVSYFVVALGSAWGWTSVVCPLLMLYFLFRVTGIPMTEAQALQTKGDDYRRYQQTTSAFVPWFHKEIA